MADISKEQPEEPEIEGSEKESQEKVEDFKGGVRISMGPEEYAHEPEDDFPEGAIVADEPDMAIGPEGIEPDGHDNVGAIEGNPPGGLQLSPRQKRPSLQQGVPGDYP